MYNIGVGLRLLELAYLMKPVSVAVMKSVGRVPVVEEELVRGTEVRLPLWLAIELEKEGVVEIREPGIKEGELRRVKFIQMQQGETLVKLDEFFYIRAKRWLKELEEEGRKRFDVAALTVVEKARRDLHDLYRVRLNKIIMSTVLGHLQSVEKSLSNEERLLARVLEHSLKEWAKYLGLEV